MKEIELVDNFCNYLKQRGYRYKRELRRGSYHSDGYVDVVILDGFLIGIEAKINGFSQVLTQVWNNVIMFPLNYILYPRKPNKKGWSKLEESYAGLIIPYKDEFKIERKPRFSKYFDRYYFKHYIWRNWVQNRVGRIFHDHEVPDDYPEEKLQKLACSYDWTKPKDQKKIEDFFK